MDIRTGTAKSGDLDIAYEDMGDENHPAVLMIMGLGAQMTFWRNGFCEKLVDQGLRVVRYDNRDVGLSSKVQGTHTGAPLLKRMARSQLGLRNAAVYTLEHMADDAAALLDHLRIEKAHVMGASMGGMIAQIFAARYQHRTKTLAVIFSSNNQALLPRRGPSSCGRSRRGRRTPPARASSPTPSASARSSAARATGRRMNNCWPTPSRATSGATTRRAWAGTWARSSAPAAWSPTTSRSPHPPS